jgi:glycosyltransferase involved in cell wall biosynthesis
MDSGNGMSEETAITIPVAKSGTINFIVNLPDNIRTLRLDPMQDAGTIEFDKIVFTEIGAIEKICRMARRVILSFRSRNRSYISMIESNTLNDVHWFQILSYIEKIYYKLSYSRSYQPGHASSYDQWIEKHDKLTDDDRGAIRRHIEAMSHIPLISIIMPVYNTPAELLRNAIDSVINQLYPYWELCIADDASTQPHIREILGEYEKRDNRIKIVYRSVNGHISEASNSALSIASGEFIALMDHDDELSEKALYRIADVINKYPQTEIIYTDEDKIDVDGRRFSPHFKSDWNQELFFSQNYISHLTVYSSRILKQAGGFRKGFEGSQDYDLTLRCINLTCPSRIYHLPEVLYHWRTIDGSTASNENAKNYSYEAGIKALEDHFRTEKGTVIELGPWPGTYRVKYPIRDPEPLVSLLIPTYNGHELLKKCVESILNKTIYNNYEIIVINNRSDCPLTLQYLDELNRCKNINVVQYDKPFNFSAINNFAVQYAKGEFIGLINNDVEVISSEWLTEIMSYAIRPKIGAVGAKLLYSDGRIQHAGVIIGLGGVAGHSHKHLPGDTPGYFCRAIIPQALSAVTAACLIVSKTAYIEVGGLDEKNLAVAFNDVDFCLKLREAGYRNVWTPYALLYHHESVSRGHDDTPEKKARFSREAQFMKTKWGKKLLADPFYNKNLTLDREDFSIGLERNI